MTARALTATGVEITTAAISWSSSSADVATVSTTGLVTAVSAGTATVSAIAGSVTGSVTVQVNPGGIVGSSGGTVSAASGNVSLQLPSGAVSSATPITVTTRPDTARTEHTVGPAYVFGPSGTTFAQPVTISLKYDANALPPFTDKAALRVARLTDGRWMPLTESVTVDSVTATVRAATRSFSTYAVVRDPCLPFDADTSLTISGQISGDDCLFTTAGRRSDYYTLRPTAGQIITLRGSGPLDGLFGLKEATSDPTIGVVWNSSSAITRELRLMSNGDPLQLFVSGRDSTKFGNYSFQRESTTSTQHECVTATNEKSYIALMPSTAVGGTMLPTNSCEVLIRFGPPAAVGKPLLVHYYPVRLLAGRQYTINGSGFAGAGSLTVFLAGQVAAQDLSSTSTRTVSITPGTTATYFIEVGSGGFQNIDLTGSWIQPAFSYNITVSRGAVVTP